MKTMTSINIFLVYSGYSVKINSGNSRSYLFSILQIKNRFLATILSVIMT